MKKFTFLKSLLLAVGLLAGNIFLQADPLLVENFDYPIGDKLTDHGWTAHSGSGQQAIDVTNGLTFTGYAGSGIGGAANLDNTGEDVNKTFTQQTSGTVYAAFLVQTQSTNSAGYFFHLGAQTIGTTFWSRVYVNGTGDGLGISGSSAPSSYVPITAGVTTLVVVKYDIATKVSSLFVLNSYSATEPATPNQTFTEGTVGNNVGSVALRQYSASQRIIVDGIRVATTWADAVAPSTSPILSATTLESFGEVAIGTTAGPKTFTLTGSNLTGNVTVGALTGFTYSTTETGTYDSPLTLSPSGGSINQTIYVKFTPAAVQSYDGNITISSQGATSINVAAQGSGILAAPTATAATSVSANGFTANWNAVAGATGYQLNVYTKTGTNATDLIISEYVEGSSSNKYLEIYNGTGSDIDLSNYQLLLFSNGTQESSPTNTVNLSGTLSNGNTIVYKNSSAALTLPDGVTATNNAAVNFNGNDAIALKKISTGAYVDIFGRIGEDPGTAWTSGSLSTLDHTLVRKSSVTSGVTSNPTSGFPTLATEWDMYNQNDASHLGSHTMNGGTSTPISGSPFTVSGGSTTSYTLSGLATNTTYYYTVKATDGSNTSAASNEISVELSSPSITVTPVDPLSFATNTGLTASKTITVSGLHLTSDIVLSVSDENVFSVSPTPLTPTNETVSETEITITYHPTVSGTHTGTLTISSTGATTVEIALSGTATPLPVVDIVSLNEDGTFNMDWNTTGTLHVYEKVTDGSGNAEGLFFSKYFEADGNNKLLEIFNGTGSSVDLTGWKVQVFQNGTTPATIDWSSTKVSTYNLSDTLAHGEVYVMYTKDPSSTCSSSFNSSWNECTSPTLQFNGNDPIRLVNANGKVIDVFGQSEGSTPKNEWTATKSDGTILKTVRQLLVRDISVVSGANAVSSNTTSFATLGTEWNLYPMDYGEGQPIACNALIEFGNYDYGSIYTTWQEIENAVNNKKVTIPNATTRPCEELKVEVKDGATIKATAYINVPIMVSETKNISDYSTLCPTCDMGIKNGGKLTVDVDNKSVRNVTIFPNGKLDVNQPVTARNLTLKAGLGNNLYDDFPTSTLKINSNGQIVLSEDFRYVRTLDDVQWYFIAFPFDVSVSSITAADGSLGTLGTDWFLKYYDGASRVQNLGAISNWKTFTGSTLEAGKGYIIGLASGTKEVIFPMGHYITLSPETSKNISVTFYGKDALNVTENHKGWNLIGNPFFGKLSGSAANFNYFTFSDGGSSKTYTQIDKSSLSGINPFTSFFVQAGNDLETSGASFDVAGRQLLPASVRNETADRVKIVYQSPTGTDETTLILDDEQTAAYEIGEDLEKWVGTGTSKPQVYTVTGGINYAFNALSYAEAQNLPLAVYTKTSGSHTFHAVASQSSTLAELTLTDKTAGKSVNLLTSDYTYSATAGTNTTRFLISARRVISSTLPQEKGNNLVVFSTNGKIVVDGLSVNSLVRVFDITGKPMAIVSAAVADKLEIPLSVAGVYQVVVESPNQIRRTIKIMHYPSR